MEFFRFTTLCESFFYYEDWRWGVLLGACLFLAVFLLQAIALYTIANHEGYDKRWMAFVPIISTYYIGVCAQKNKTLKLDTKKFALALMIVESVICILYTMYYIGYAVVENAGFIEYDYSSLIYGGPMLAEQIPQALVFPAVCFEIIGLIAGYSELIYLIMYILLLNTFFQTYSSRRYFIFTIFCIFFPIGGIFMFVVRNNRGVNYYEYMRAEQERRYQIYRQNQNYYDPYNRYNNPPPPPQDYNRGYQDGYNAARGGQNQNSQSDDPFSGLGKGKDDDPFN